jgi:hypothetical protein
MIAGDERCEGTRVVPLISVTRLRLRSLRFLPFFIVRSLGTSRQAQRTDGFVAGWTGNEGVRAFWTATAWRDEAAMRAFRSAEPHLTAMRKLLLWCDEGSYAHWEQDTFDLPDPSAAHRRLMETGRISKVLHPSADQQKGRTAGERLPRRGSAMRPGSRQG